MSEKLYAKRDIMAQGQHYVKHVSAMTGEGLHSKSDIAAELAHRDVEIERLQAELQQAQQSAAEAMRQLCLREVSRRDVSTALHDIERRIRSLPIADVPVPPTEIPAIRLTKFNDVCEVAIEFGKTWVTVIRDSGDVIDHIVESSGIHKAIADVEHTPMTCTETYCPKRSTNGGPWCPCEDVEHGEGEN